MSTLEEQIKRIADAAFAQTEPVERPISVVEYAAPIELRPAISEPLRRGAGRRRLLTFAATVLVVTLVGGLLLVMRRDTDPTPTDDREGLSVVEALRDLPIEIETQLEASDGDLRIAGVDLAALEELTGIDRPAANDDPTSWLRLAMGDDDVSVPRSELFHAVLTGADASDPELPFSAVDVGGFITVQIGGMQRVDPFDLFTLISAEESVQLAAGQDKFLQIGDGEPGQRNVAARTPLRPIGKPLLVGFDPARKVVAIGQGADLVPAWLDESGQTMADSSPDLLAVAEQLDRLDGLTTFELIGQDFSFADVVQGDAEGLDEMMVIDRPFSRLGIGRSGIGASEQTVFVYAFDDDADASAAQPSVEAAFAPDNVVATPVGATGQVMGSFVAVESVEAIGRTVVVAAHALDDPKDGSWVIPPIYFHR